MISRRISSTHTTGHVDTSESSTELLEQLLLYRTGCELSGVSRSVALAPPVAHESQKLDGS